MTRLTGEFHTDLSAQAALEACADAVHQLGWEVESVRPGRVSTFPHGAGSVPKIEFELAESSEGTDVRIIGSDTEDQQLDQAAIVAELDRARDAMTSAFESAEEEPAGDDQEPDDEPEAAPRRGVAPNPQATADQQTGSVQQVPAGWYPDAYDSSRLQYWDGEKWTEDYKPFERPEVVANEPGPAANERVLTKSAGDIAPATDSAAQAGEVMWALSLGFGCVAGVSGGFGVSIINYWVPFGFGVAGIALAVVAKLQPGRAPRWAAIAVTASVIGLIAGIGGYGDFQDLQDELNEFGAP